MTDYAPALHVLCKWVWLKKKAEKKKTPNNKMLSGTNLNKPHGNIMNGAEQTFL